MSGVTSQPSDEANSNPDIPPENSPTVSENSPAMPPGGLWTPSFIGLVATQFLGALNDNMFRWLLIPIGKNLVTAMGLKPAYALSVGSALFLVPFLLLAAPAGYLADRFSKRHVIIGCKVGEVVVMMLGIGAILSGNLWLMGIVLFLMGAQSALFGPSKFGSIPEMVREDRISAANGVIGMTTMVSIILGVIAGGYLYDWTTVDIAEPGQHQWWLSAIALIGVALVGWFVSLMIGPLKVANPERPFPINPVKQTVRDLLGLISHRGVFLAALGAAFFWSIGALFQMNVDKFAEFELFVQQQHMGPLLAVLVLGIGFGSMVAGIWSGGKIQLGIVPIGSAGIAIGAMLLFTVPECSPGQPNNWSYGWTCVWLFLLGSAAGLYDIPLQAFIQARSPIKSRGAILASANFLSFSGMLTAAGAFFLLGGVCGWSARTIFLAAGLCVIPAGLLAVWLIPGDTARVLAGLLVRFLYRIRITGRENVPATGGVLLTPNHISWIDGLLLWLKCDRPVRFVAYADYANAWFLRRLARDVNTIPIEPGRKSMVRSIRAAREALRQGDLVCIFPEGSLSRTGEMSEFHSGFLSILKDSDAVVVPVHLGGLWGSIFSHERGRVFWKWPLRWPYPVLIRFGQPMHEVTDAEQVRDAVLKLGNLDEEPDEKSKPDEKSEPDEKSGSDEKSE